MTDRSPVTADAARVQMIRSTRTWSPLGPVAEAVAAASETERRIYVERRGDHYRWSLATRGGGYPLVRIAARFLGVDYQRIFVGFRTLPDGTAILCEDPDQVDLPDTWTLLELDGTMTAASAARSINAALAAGRAPQ